jgi:hypothetical protein
MANKELEIVLNGAETCLDESKLWIRETEATIHRVCSDVNLFDCQTSNQKVIVGDSRSIQVQKAGKVRVNFARRNKIVTDFLLEDTNCH